MNGKSEVGIMIFARMGSRRLPGKMLMPFAGMTLLEWVVRRAQTLAYPLVVATSDSSADDILASATARLGVPVFRGSENDLLSRAIDCAKTLGWQAFARLCGDRPFFDAAELQHALEAMRSDLGSRPGIDLYTNNLHRNATAGMTTEVVRLAALERAAAAMPSAYEREHMTQWLYAHPGQTRIVELGDGHQDLSGLSLAVDRLADLQRLNELLQTASGSSHVGVDVRDLVVSGRIAQP